MCVPLAHFRSVLSKSLWATWIQRQCRIFIRRLHLSRFVQLKYVFIKFKKGRKGNALYGPFYQYKYTFGQIHGCQRDITPPPLHFGQSKSKTFAFIKRWITTCTPHPHTPLSGFENFLRSFLMITYTAVIKNSIKLSFRYIKSDFNNFLYLLRWRKSVCNSSWQPQMHHSDDEKIASWPSKNSNSRIRNKMNCKTNYYLLNGSMYFYPYPIFQNWIISQIFWWQKIAGWPSKDCNSRLRNKINHKNNYGRTFTTIQFS